MTLSRPQTDVSPTEPAPTYADVHRRQFLRQSAATILALPFVTHTYADETPPSNRVTLACIGVGGQGRGNMHAFLNDERVQLVAVCDVDRDRAEAAARTVDDFYAKRKKNGACRGCDWTQDFRDVVARPDIDAVMIGTPDHTHGLIAVHAMRQGKDVYCEKPLAYSVAEGRAMVEAAQTYGRVLQTGTQRRSNGRIRHACELVLNGCIGTLTAVKVGLPRGFQIRNGAFSGRQSEHPVPQKLDYDKWLGPAPYAPYTPGRCHFNFRWILDYGEGYISDWGAHYLDVAHWGIAADRTGPTAVEAEATFPQDGLYDAPTDFTIVYTYTQGPTVLCSTEETLGIRFEGEDGWIHVEKPGAPQVSASKHDILEKTILPTDTHLYRSNNHHRNFIDCVFSREDPAADAETGHRSASVCHVGMIAARLGRALRWNPETEQFPDDPAANRLLARMMRPPWVI